MDIDFAKLRLQLKQDCSFSEEEKLDALQASFLKVDAAPDDALWWLLLASSSFYENRDDSAEAELAVDEKVS